MCAKSFVDYFRFESTIRKVALIFIWMSLVFNVGVSNAQIRNWNTDDGAWSNAANWSPAGPAPQFNELVRIGNIPGVETSTVTLDTSQLISGLQLTNGMNLNTGDGYLQVFGETLVSDDVGGTSGRSALLVNGAGGEAVDFRTFDLNVVDGGFVNLFSGGQIRSDNMIFVDSASTLAVAGSGGIINLYGNSPTAFSLSGNLEAISGLGIVINQMGTGLVDLDGSGTGTVILDGGFFGQSNLAIHGTALTDAFNGTIHMATGSILNMNLSEGWTADGNIYVSRNANDDFARITGGPLELTGAITLLSGAEAALTRIESNTTFQNGAQVYIEEDSELVVTGSSLIDGGNFTLEQDAQLRFVGAVDFAGGVLTTFNDQAIDGFIDFTGATDWHGNATINGIAKQNGNAVVSDASVIDANVLDLDGQAEQTEWDVNRELVVNADKIDDSIANRFDGTFNINAGIFSELIVNLTDATDHWSMNGTINLFNNLPFEIPRISGSKMQLSGEMNIHGAGIRIAADTDFVDGSVSTFQTLDSSLVMNGQTTVEAGAMFVDEGMVINGGTLTLQDGASLDQAGLINRGLIEVGNPTGIAGAARFENTSEARWQVEIGGYISGDEFDVLLVSNGNTTLSGILSVKLIDAGNGLFAPQVNDEFTILSSVNPIVGQFDNEPVSVSDGNGYQWEVLYNPNDVTLRLVSIDDGFIIGDVNQDGVVSLLDVSPFVEALTTGVYEIRADINCDGAVDLLDVSLFVELLAG